MCKTRHLQPTSSRPAPPAVHLLCFSKTSFLALRAALALLTSGLKTPLPATHYCSVECPLRTTLDFMSDSLATVFSEVKQPRQADTPACAGAASETRNTTPSSSRA